MRKKTTNNIDIERKVYNFLSNKKIDIKNKTLLLAFSSGIDSTVLLDVLLKIKDELKFDISIAHVNYNLRGNYSILDMNLAIDIAKKNNIEIYIENIKQGQYTNKNLQAEARADRYNFFAKLYNQKLFDYLITAHHKDDLLETIIYRMLKGSSSNVYKSMPSKKCYTLRPLINVYKTDIKKYAKENNIEYREDLSNKENKYSRNKIRNIIIPLFEEINSSSKDNIINLSKTVYIETKYLRLKTKRLYKKYVKNNTLPIDIFCRFNILIQNRILKKLMFNNKLEISAKRIKELQKIIKSGKDRITAKFGNKYIVKKNNTIAITDSIKRYRDELKLIIDKDGTYNFYDTQLKVEYININSIENINFKDNSKLYLNISYPFTIRSKNVGDTIIDNYLAKKLKLKKLFIDLKIDPDKRIKVPVIEKDNSIIAVWFALLDNSKKNRISKQAFVEKDSKVIVIIKN